MDNATPGDSTAKHIKSALPFGSEFSPSQIDLATVLQFAHNHGGQAPQ
ncbi:MAG: hypothetical protein WCT12_04490 [Verrucomicrobiota bacterium]